MYIFWLIVLMIRVIVVYLNYVDLCIRLDIFFIVIYIGENDRN